MGWGRGGGIFYRSHYLRQLCKIDFEHLLLQNQLAARNNSAAATESAFREDGSAIGKTTAPMEAMNRRPSAVSVG